MEGSFSQPPARRRGLPPIHQVRITVEEMAEDMEIIFTPPGTPVRGKFNILKPIEYVEFDRCPICLAASPTSREHVPQESLGGRVVTKTCHTCNNELGSKLEGHLQDWFDGASRLVRVEGEGAPGRQVVPRVLHRQTPDGRFVEVYEVTTDSVSDNLRQGGLQATYTPPERARWRTAALKHAYVAACCALGHIPEGDDAEEIRVELIAARDAERRRPLQMGPHASSVSLLRTADGLQGPPLALVALEDGAAEDPELWLSMGGVVLVGWPLVEQPA